MSDKNRSLTNRDNDPLIHGNDIRGILALLDDVIGIRDTPLRRKRLIAGLCDLIGAEDWSLENSPPAITPPLAPEDTDHEEMMIVSRIDTHSNLRPQTLVIRRRSHPFTERERRIASMILEEVKWLLAPAIGASRKPFNLSPRENQVLGLLVAGKDRKAIADRLDLSPNTVSGYIRTLYRKMGIRSHVELLTKTSAGKQDI